MTNECAHCSERGAGAENTIWCAECLMWWRAETKREDLDQATSRIAALEAEVARLKRELLETTKSHQARNDEVAAFKDWREAIARLVNCDPEPAAVLAGVRSAVQAEREACARIADQYETGDYHYDWIGERIAEQILARDAAIPEAQEGK